MKDGDRYSITFDAALHDPDVIQRAAYKFLDAFALTIRLDPERSQIVCDLDFLESFSGSREETEKHFRIEVLDQELRKRIKAETEQERNLILAHAFSKTGLADE